jgi:hypothetical protein
METFGKDPINWNTIVKSEAIDIQGKHIGCILGIYEPSVVIKRGSIRKTKLYIPKNLILKLNAQLLQFSITENEAKHLYDEPVTFGEESLSSLEVMINKNLYYKPGYSRRHYTINLQKKAVVPDRSNNELANNQTEYSHQNYVNAVGHKIYDKLSMLRSSIAARNRLAALLAFISGILFLFSGYRANIAIYNFVIEEALSYSNEEVWIFLLTLIRLLALISQLGGIAVLIGAGLFIINRINIAKFFIIVGTGQGIIIVFTKVILALWEGNLIFVLNYAMWLTTSAVGLGVLFVIISQFIAKGKNDGIIIKSFRFITGRSSLHAKSTG